MNPDELRKLAYEIVPSASLAHANLLAAADAWDIEIARSEGLAALARDYAGQIADLHERLEAAEGVIDAVQNHFAYGGYMEAPEIGDALAALAGEEK